MYERYGERVQFFVLYIREAHPADDWAREVNPRLKFIKDPTNLFERFQVANTCVNDLKISIPTLIDGMDNSTAHAYKSWPDRLYLVGKDGNIAYAGAPGPQGFKPKQLEAAIDAELRIIGRSEASPAAPASN